MASLQGSLVLPTDQLFDQVENSEKLLITIADSGQPFKMT